jgi:GT2 family glycosyltransferase
MPMSALIDSATAVARRDTAEWPRVTVAIVAYNRRDALRTTLATVLGELDYPGDRLEVIVVDNASDDGTDAMVAREFPGVRLIRSEQNLGAPGWNLAFAAGTGDWFLVLDDDCFVAGDAVKRAVAAAEANAAALVSFRVRSSVDPEYYFTDEYVTGLLSFWGCAWLIARPALEHVGGYDPAIFIWANELDLTLRLLDGGFRHLYLPEVVAVHMKAPQPQTFNEHVHVTTNGHLAYVAAKLLRPLDAARVVSRLITLTLLDAAAVSPRSLTKTLPSVLAGALRGARARSPVRAAVSAAARDNFGSYANPLRFLRGPLERLPRRQPGPSADDRWARFRERRPRWFPATSAYVEV